MSGLKIRKGDRVVVLQGKDRGKEGEVMFAFPENQTVIVEGGVAIIFGTTELRFQGPGESPVSSKYRYTSIYVDREGQWRMLALQMQEYTPR